MERQILTKKEYLKLLNATIYKREASQHLSNYNFYNKNFYTVKEFCDNERARFNEALANEYTSLNYCIYLLSQFKGAILTCYENNQKTQKLHIHYAFVYLGKDGELYVCDPAMAKRTLGNLNGESAYNQLSNKELFYHIKFKAYQLLNSQKEYNNGFKLIGLQSNGEELKWKDGLRMFQKYDVRFGINPNDNTNKFAEAYENTKKLSLRDLLSRTTKSDMERIKNEIALMDTPKTTAGAKR